VAVSRGDLLAGIGDARPQAATVDGLGDVFLRSPTFAEWYPLMLEQAKHDGGHVPDSVVSKTIIACLCDEDGKRLLEDGDGEAVLSNKPAVVMGLYNACKKALADAVATQEEIAGN
jgi:hypothetical protein